jgi:phage recombination protein Bet
MNAVPNAVTLAQPQPGGTLALSEDEAIRVLGASLYPGARPESIRLVLAWCRATGRDPMKKPIHVVPMWVKDATTGKGEMRDTLMPGIGTYRSDAAATGQYAGKSEPEFGPEVVGKVGDIQMRYPAWCRLTVQRIVGGQVRNFTAKEFWLENYATASRDTASPNAMWRKRPYGQLAKCCEAQALRMAFPDETGATATVEEMDGKSFDGPTIDAIPTPQGNVQPAELDHPKAEVFDRRDAINTEIPLSPQAPPKRTARQWLDDLRMRVAQCQTTAELDHIATSEEVRKASQHFKNGALTELNEIMADAMQRLSEHADAAGTEPTEAAEPVLADADEMFPGAVA